MYSDNLPIGIPMPEEIKIIYKGAHRERNQPVPVQGFKTFVTGCPICTLTFGAGQKNNQCHGMVVLARLGALENKTLVTLLFV